MDLKRWFGYRKGSRGHYGRNKHTDKSRNSLSSSSSSSSSSVCVGVAALQVEKGGLREDRLEKK
jgi:hypothetical protein